MKWAFFLLVNTADQPLFGLAKKLASPESNPLSSRYRSVVSNNKIEDMTNMLETKITLASQFITEYIEKSDYTYRDIAVLAGFSSEQVIYMFMKGEARVPLDCVPALAGALGCDGAQLMLLAMQQYFNPEMMIQIQECFTAPAISDNERDWLNTIRQVSGGTVPPLKEHQRRKLETLLKLVR